MPRHQYWLYTLQHSRFSANSYGMSGHVLVNIKILRMWAASVRIIYFARVQIPREPQLVAVRRQVFWLLPHRVAPSRWWCDTQVFHNQWHDAKRRVVKELQQRVLSRTLTWFPFHPLADKPREEPQHNQFATAKIHFLFHSTIIIPTICNLNNEIQKMKY